MSEGEDDTTYYVYVDRTEDTGAPFYVGYGNRYRVRCLLKRNRWHTHIAKKHGIVRKTIHAVCSEDEAKALEVKAIAELHTFVDDPEYNGVGCNLTPGGEGHRPCKAERERMRQRALKRWNDPEKRQRWIDGMQGGHIGITHSPEWCKAHSEKMKGENNPNWGGKSVKPSTRIKMSVAHSGQPTWNKGIKMPEETFAWRFKYVIIVDTDENINEFPSQKEAAYFLAEKLEMSHYTMRGYLTRRDVEIRGYKIVYSDNESKT